MLSRLHKQIQRRHFDWRCRDVLDTPAIQPRGEIPVIVSMVCQRDLIMYLLAIKSFYRYLRRGRIVIINDGTLTPANIELLRRHVQPSEIVEAASLVSDKCPRYISWKKLFCIARYVDEEFTIQLDSDTLTLEPVPEVNESIDERRSFILGTHPDQKVAPVAQFVEAAHRSPSNHVQIVAERHLDRLEGNGELRYVRGCSGFDGFAPGAFDLRKLEDFSQRMFSLIGDKWGEWGSEQATSNFIVANHERSSVLPYPKYYNYWGTEQDAAFVHFVGSHRYRDGVYWRTAARVIDKLERA